MKWAGLMKLMIEVYCPRNEIQKLETELWNLTVKGIDLISYTQMFQELILLCIRMVPGEEDRVERAYTSGSNKRKGYVGFLPYCNKCRLHHEGLGTIRCGNCKKIKHQTRYCRVTVTPNTEGAAFGNQQGISCYECGRPSHFKKDCPKLRSQNRENQTRNKTGGNVFTAKAYTIGEGGTNPDSNVVTGTFLLNNCYAFMLFDSSADRSFVSTTFSALLDVAPFTLDTSYAVELADERISKTNIILRGCTLGLLGHPFNIDLMPVELGSFDVIIGMDWLGKYHTFVICDEKVIRIPYGDEVLIIRCDNYNGESKLNIISCTKTQSIFRMDVRKEYEGHLKLILKLLNKEELYAKFSKCEFWLSKILALPEGSKKFVVYCNASHKGLGAVLMQKEKIIAYASHQLKCVVFTDHKSLQPILDQKELNMRQRCWLVLLRDYDCEIQYHTGKANVVAESKREKQTATKCSSCGALYTRDCSCSKGSVEDKVLVPKPPKNYARCAKCGHPVNGLYCQGCSLLREKLKEYLVTYLKYFQDTSESSDNSTNDVNAPREPIVVKQDHGVNPPHIDKCCCECGNALDGIFCQQCICKSCGKGAYTGYNCPPKVLIISNPELFNQTMNNELPQTLPSFDLVPCVSKPNSVDESSNIFNPPPQPPIYSCEFCRSNAQYGHYCAPQAPFNNPEPGYSQDLNFSQNIHNLQQ
nr:reverse transcriptase domain-containing protein [Tanacetum cinerariifolium]